MINRVLKLQKKIKDNNYYLITNPVNFSYLLNLNYNLQEKEAYLLISKNEAYLITPLMLINYYKNLCNKNKIKLKTITNKSKLFEFLKDKSNEGQTKIVIDKLSITLTEFQILKKYLTNKLKIGTDPTENLRQIKDETEIDNIEKAQKLTAKILAKSIRFLKNNWHKNISEDDLACYIAETAAKYNCPKLSFDPVVASGINSTNPHHRPEQKIIKSGVLLIDLGVNYNGYCSDLTRTFFIGEPDSEFKTIYDIVLKTLSACRNKAKTAKNLYDLHTEAVKLFSKHNLSQYFIHSIGHGVGRQIHELPFADKKDKNNLTENTVFTLEPAVYLKNKFGIRIEDIIIKTKILKEIRSYPKNLNDIIIKL